MPSGGRGNLGEKLQCTLSPLMTEAKDPGQMTQALGKGRHLSLLSPHVTVCWRGQGPEQGLRDRLQACRALSRGEGASEERTCFLRIPLWARWHALARAFTSTRAHSLQGALLSPQLPWGTLHSGRRTCTTNRPSEWCSKCFRERLKQGRLAGSTGWGEGR